MDYRRSSTIMSIALIALTMVVAGGGLFIAGGGGAHGVVTNSMRL